jgi:hypothetical protein
MAEDSFQPCQLCLPWSVWADPRRFDETRSICEAEEQTFPVDSVLRIIFMIHHATGYPLARWEVCNLWDFGSTHVTNDYNLWRSVAKVMAQVLVSARIGFRALLRNMPMMKAIQKTLTFPINIRKVTNILMLWPSLTQCLVRKDIWLSMNDQTIKFCASCFSKIGRSNLP